jgi:predicted nucleotidyltransferase
MGTASMTVAYPSLEPTAPVFPTDLHRAAAEAVVDYWVLDERVQAVILTGSCARGKGTPESCVDITVLVAPSDLGALHEEEKPRFEAFLASDPACVALAHSVPWSGIDPSYSDGQFVPGEHGWTTGADNYELEIGNTLAWTRAMLWRGRRWKDMLHAYLPYYDETMRQERLSHVIRCARNNLEHIVPYAHRGLYFQCFKRLYHAFEEYLQALFIRRRVYPVAYDKWVQEQIVEILGEPQLYEELAGVLTMPGFSVDAFRDRAGRMQALVEQLTS